MVISGIFNCLNRVRVAVIGDYMYDVYTKGAIHRISAEAPVPILHVENEEGRPGGAGNVALNLLSLGADVIAIGRVGSDIWGNKIIQELAEEGVDTQALYIQELLQTPVKNRFIAESQQLLRVDFEQVSPISRAFEKKFIEALPRLLEKVDIIAISDYDKGFLSPPLLRAIIHLAHLKKITTIVDPKGEDFKKYQGANILKPNLQEAYTASGLSKKASLQEVARRLFEKIEVETLMITCSEEGISIFTRQGTQNQFPVRSKEVKDVTGAGDTVLAVASIVLANGLDIQCAAQLANIAAGIAIERIGCARVSLTLLAERLLEWNLKNKVFDKDHLFVLKQALQGKYYSVLGWYGKQEMSSSLFQSIRKLSSPQCKLILYMAETIPNKGFLDLLTSLFEVDFIVLQCDNFQKFCDFLQPHRIFILKEDLSLHQCTGSASIEEGSSSSSLSCLS